MMRLLAGFASLAALTSTISVPAHASARAAANAFVVSSTPLVVQAPADVYFGVYRLSNLSVRNAIHDMTIEGDSPLALPGQVERIAAVESALGAWEVNYPRDPWLPGTMLAFADFLTGKQIAQYNHTAFSVYDEIALLYPGTPAGQTARATLASFVFIPQFDLESEAGPHSIPRIFEAVPTRIGENRPHRFL
jgi:hypothetical protein